MGAQVISREILELSPFIVKVLWQDGTVNGTGFFCMPNGFILTCRHVVDQLLGHGVGANEIDIAWSDSRFKAIFRADLSPDFSDLAVLELAQSTCVTMKDLPFLPLDLTWSLKFDDPLESFGFPQRAAWSADGIPVRGILGGMDSTRLVGVNGLEGIWVYVLQGWNLGNIRGGFSGAPVLDRKRNKVVGLLAANDREVQAFLVPLKALCDRWPELRDFHDVSRKLRERLAAEARSKLTEKLNQTPFIPLRLERGILAVEQDAQKRATASPVRQWQPVENSFLLSIVGRHILSADVGAGKTTFLWWLATALFEKTNFVPLLLTCAEWERNGVLTWSDLRNRLVSKYETEFLASDIEEFFENAFGNFKLFFLLDALDQIESRQYSSLARRIFDAVQGRTILVTARPSAALGFETTPDVTFLTLKSFSSGDQPVYFGEYYEKARQLGAMSPELAQVPLLAYMIRLLVKESIANEIKTRTELYSRFLAYVVSIHESNQAAFVDTPSLINNIRASLRLLAYRGMAEKQPQLQRIDASLYGALQNLVPIEQLTKFGLVNLILEGGEHVLFFSHLSFQEFLAAEYFATHQELYLGLLKEQWNPKWKETFAFLAGLKGEEVVIRLLSNNDHLIDRECFLAAACAKEVKVLSESTANRIASRLFSVRYFIPGEVIGALVNLRDPRFLRYLLQNKEGVVASTALAALGSSRLLDTQARVDQVKFGLKHSSRRVRIAALNAAAIICDSADEPTLTSFIAYLEKEVLPTNSNFESDIVLSRYWDRLLAIPISDGFERLLDDYLESPNNAVLEDFLRNFQFRPHNPAEIQSIGPFSEYLDRLVVEKLSHDIGLPKDRWRGEDRELYVLAEIFQRSCLASSIDTMASWPDGPSDFLPAAKAIAFRHHDVKSSTVDRLLALLDRIGTRRLSPITKIDAQTAPAVLEGILDAFRWSGDPLEPLIISKLERFLDHEEWSIRCATIDALTGSGPNLAPENIARIVQGLSEDPYVGCHAARALARLGSHLRQEHLCAIDETLGSPSLQAGVRAAIAAELLDLQPRLTSNLVSICIDEMVKAQAFHQSLDIETTLYLSLQRGAPGIDARLQERLRSANSDVERLVIARVYWAARVTDFADPTLLKSARAWLSHESLDFRSAALKILALNAIQVPTGWFEAIQDMLTEPEVRYSALKVLAKITSNKKSVSTPLFVQALADADSLVRFAACDFAEDLRLASDPAIELALVRLLRDSDTMVRSAAFQALAVVDTGLKGSTRKALLRHVDYYDSDKEQWEQKVHSLSCICENNKDLFRKALRRMVRRSSVYGNHEQYKILQSFFEKGISLPKFSLWRMLEIGERPWWTASWFRVIVLYLSYAFILTRIGCSLLEATFSAMITSIVYVIINPLFGWRLREQLLTRRALNEIRNRN